MLRRGVSWRYLTLRRALLSALFLLGTCGMLSSFYQVQDSWREYARSKDLVEWAKTAGQMMTVAQHLAYERGRTAVVLSAPARISDADRRFIDERRQLSEPLIAALYEKSIAAQDEGSQAFHQSWQRLREMRKQVDAESVLPLSRRNPELVTRWTNEMTAFLTQTETLARHLIRHYRQTADVHRLNALGFLSYRLRIQLGQEASTIARQVASQKPMSSKVTNAIYEMRGIQKVLWADLNRTVDFLGNAEMKAAEYKLKQQRDALRVLQDQALEAWSKGRATDVPLAALTAHAAPLLDGFSALMSHAIQEANRNAKEKMESSQRDLMTHLALAASILIVMLLAVFYLLAKVVRPLEAVDEKLRRLHYADWAATNLRLNEIERLHETASMLERVFAEKRQLEERLRDMAFFDPLTQLPNRRLMEDRLQQKILRAKRQHSLLAVLFIDLDDFKPVNDAFGHGTGDSVLRVVAERITLCIRESDTVSRHGGDEFVVLLPDLNLPNAALEVAEKIREALAQPFYMDNGQSLGISSSIGIAIYPIHSESEKELIRLGDEAMYAAKTSGGNKIQMARLSVNEEK